jgi:glycosyltransferase involved in cell wall biosynthesis
VRDAITDGVSGTLLDFFDVGGLSDALIAACRDPEGRTAMRQAARETAVARFDSTAGRSAWLSLVAEIAGPQLALSKG